MALHSRGAVACAETTAIYHGNLKIAQKLLTFPHDPLHTRIHRKRTFRHGVSLSKSPAITHHNRDFRNKLWCTGYIGERWQEVGILMFEQTPAICKVEN